MNTPLRRLSVAVMLLFGLLLVNINYLQIVRADDLHNNSSNSRLISEEYSRERGPILVGPDPVASSIETDDRLKYLRQYTNGELYAPATGFYSLVYGSNGIEQAENSVLAGTDDSLFVRRVIDLLTGAQPKGASVKLTLNAKAQRAAYRGLQRTGGKGAVVAIDPTTGAILALASSPSYDPGQLASHSTAEVKANYEALDADPSRPMLNRALRQTYPPGSTFKIVTAAAALESGRYSPQSPVLNDAELDLPQTSVTLPNFDNGPCSAGPPTLTDALKRSCNVAFGKVGLELGADALRTQAEKFGFNDAFEVPMRSVASRFPEAPDEPQTALSAIGQFDVRATPLQMAMVAATVANRGVSMAPYLVQEVRAPDAVTVLDSTRPRELGTAVSSQTAASLAQMMTAVVDDGTGTNAQIDGVQVAGKTGTAQQGRGRKPHAWFISFAPSDNDAKVAVAVVIEDGGGEAEVSGNELAAPIARDVMRAVLGR